MTAHEDAAVRRRALRRRLEQARIDAGESLAGVAGSLGWTLPELLLVAAVADGFDDGRLATLAGRYGLPADAYAGIPAPPESPLGREVRVLAHYEGEAATIRTFEPFVIPGLLQTRAYAESVLRLYAPPEKVEALVAARLARQELLRNDNSPQMIFLIDESALHRWAGATGPGPAVMREQLAHLRRTAGDPRVRIHIIPYAAGVHEGVKGPFVILDSAEPLLYLEDAKGDVLTADPADVRRHTERFATLLAAATDPAGAVTLFDRAARGLGDS